MPIRTLTTSLPAVLKNGGEPLGYLITPTPEAPFHQVEINNCRGQQNEEACHRQKPSNQASRGMRYCRPSAKGGHYHEVCDDDLHGACSKTNLGTCNRN